jgi:hypothetical protein
MAEDEKQSLGQIITGIKETIQQKWAEMHEQLTSPEQRKALRSEIKNAVAGLGKTIKQFDPRKSKPTKKAAKKKTSVKKKAAPRKKAAKKRK